MIDRHAWQSQDDRLVSDGGAELSITRPCAGSGGVQYLARRDRQRLVGASPTQLRSCDKGVAIRIGPEPRSAVPKGRSEGGNRPAISLVQIHIPGADAVAKAIPVGVIPNAPSSVARNLCGVSPLIKSLEAFPTEERQDDQPAKMRCHHIVLAKCAAVEAGMSGQTITGQTAAAPNDDQTTAAIDRTANVFSRAA